MISRVPAPRLRLHLVCKRAALLYQSLQLNESLWNEIKDKSRLAESYPVWIHWWLTRLWESSDSHRGYAPPFFFFFITSNPLMRATEDDWCLLFGKARYKIATQLIFKLASRQGNSRGCSRPLVSASLWLCMEVGKVEWPSQSPAFSWECMGKIESRHPFSQPDFF